MLLYISPSSPYARVVRLLLASLQSPTKPKEIAVNVFDNKPDFLALNPLGKVPCLQLDNNDALVDSTLICEYLDSELGQGLWHKPFENNWALKSAYLCSKGLIDIAVAWRVEKAKAQGDAFWMQRFHDGIERTLSHLEQQTERFEVDSMAKLSLQAGLGYLSFRHAELMWQQRYPRLADFLLREEALPRARDNALSELEAS